MDMNELTTTANELDDKNRSAILKIIDFKTENDMEKVLAKMEHMFAHANAQMENKFAQIDSKFAQMDAKFTHVEDKIDTMKWVMGIAGGVLTLMIAFLAFKVK